MTETKNNFKIYDFNEKKQDSTLSNNVKNFYILHHYFWGCKNTEEEYVYSESEINSKKIQNYASNHTYKKYPIEAYRLESKKHNIDIDRLLLKTLQDKFEWAKDVDENFKF